MFRKIVAAVAAVVISGAIAWGGSLALLTPTSACNEPSQILACANTIINTLNGVGTTAPITLGTSGTVSGASPLTLNTQSGIAQFTGVTVAGNANSGNLVLNNSFVSAASRCLVTIDTTTAAGGSGPAVRAAQPTAGVLTITLTNATATTTGASSFDLAFYCFF